MNKEERFYIDELQSIRGFCLHSDKEDVYKYIYSLQQENKLLKEKVNQLEINRDELKKYIQYLIYNIEPKGVRVNFNCEYDSEEDYIRGMEEKSRLETLKEVLSKMQEPERGENNE